MPPKKPGKPEQRRYADPAPGGRRGNKKDDDDEALLDAAEAAVADARRELEEARDAAGRPLARQLARLRQQFGDSHPGDTLAQPPPAGAGRKALEAELNGLNELADSKLRASAADRNELGQHYFFVALDVLYQVLWLGVGDLDGWCREVPPALQVPTLKGPKPEWPAKPMGLALRRLLELYAGKPDFTQAEPGPPRPMPVRPPQWGTVGRRSNEAIGPLWKIGRACLVFCPSHVPAVLYQARRFMDNSDFAAAQDCLTEAASSPHFAADAARIQALLEECRAEEKRVKEGFSGDGTDSFECSLCYEEAADPVVVNPCRHIFCRRCCYQLLNCSPRRCPLCRASWENDATFNVRGIPSPTAHDYCCRRLTAMHPTKLNPVTKLQEASDVTDPAAWRGLPESERQVAARIWTNLGLTITWGKLRNDNDGFLRPMPEFPPADVSGVPFSAERCFAMSIECDERYSDAYMHAALNLLCLPPGTTTTIRGEAWDVLRVIAAGCVLAPADGLMNFAAARVLIDAGVPIPPDGVPIPSPPGAASEAKGSAPTRLTPKSAFTALEKYYGSNMSSAKLQADFLTIMVAAYSDGTDRISVLGQEQSL